MFNIELLGFKMIKNDYWIIELLNIETSDYDGCLIAISNILGNCDFLYLGQLIKRIRYWR